MTILPKDKTEYGRKSFHSNGGKLFNMLPLEGHCLRKLDFSSFLESHYSSLSFNITADIKKLFPLSCILRYWTHVYSSFKLLKCSASFRFSHIIAYNVISMNLRVNYALLRSIYRRNSPCISFAGVTQCN